MDTLKYTSDNNNLLQLECFPCVRMDKGKYLLHQRYLLQKGNKVLGIVQCVRQQSIYMRHVTDSLSMTITGKEAHYMQGVLRNMYPGTDWQREKISYMHFRWVERFPHMPVTDDVRKAAPVQTTLGVSCKSYHNQV